MLSPAVLEGKHWESESSVTDAFASISEKMSEKGHSFASASKCYAKAYALLHKKLRTGDMERLVPPADLATHNAACKALLLRLRPWLGTKQRQVRYFT